MNNVSMKNEKFCIFAILLSIARYTLLIAHCLLLIAHCSFSAYAQQNPLTIAIIQPHDVTAYQEAVEGFLKSLRRQLKQDFNTVIYESPQGLYTTLQQEKNSSKPSTMALILTVGTEATAAIARTVTNIPIVFTMVLDPESILHQRHDIVGASLNIPAEFQLNMIKELLPNAEKIGIIYDPNKNAGFVEDNTVLAEKFHLHIKPFSVTSQKDIPKALEQLSREADVLWGIVDNTVYTSRTTEFIIRYTVKEHIPFIGISASYVKAGALCALVFDNKDIGRQSAELAARILSATPASELQITTPESIHLAINLRTAEIIGVKIPQVIREKAAIVYE
jgi:putative ABC transport system substrate-binding protein